MSGYSGAPFYFDHANRVMSQRQPGTIHTQDNDLTIFFKRYLLEKAVSVYDWDLPENWSRDYFLYVLYLWGTVAVIETNKYGVIPQGCGLKGYTVQYQPRQAIIVNPLLKGIREPIIDEQTVLFKMMPDFGGIADLVSFYAGQMAIAAQTITTNLVNSKLSFAFAASNKAGAESFKALYDNYAKGNPAVFYDSKLIGDDGKPTWEMFEQNVGQNYIVDRLLSDMRKLEAEYDTKIGIPNANTDKRERLISDEVNANNVEIYAAASRRLDCFRESCRKVKDMFGVEIAVDWRVDIMPEAGEVETDVR